MIPSSPPVLPHQDQKSFGMWWQLLTFIFAAHLCLFPLLILSATVGLAHPLFQITASIPLVWNTSAPMGRVPWSAAWIWCATLLRRAISLELWTTTFHSEFRLHHWGIVFLSRASMWLCCLGFDKGFSVFTFAPCFWQILKKVGDAVLLKSSL